MQEEPLLRNMGIIAGLFYLTLPQIQRFRPALRLDINIFLHQWVNHVKFGLKLYH